MKYTAKEFTSDFIAYLKANLNTIITDNNTSYNDSVLQTIDTTYNYFYSTENEVELRADAAIIYTTPTFYRNENATNKNAITRQWSVAIAFSDAVRDANEEVLSKILRYETCMQKIIEDFFKRVGFCQPEIIDIEHKTESDDMNCYRIINFILIFTIAGG